MMPLCEFKRCRSIAEVTLGSNVKTGGDLSAAQSANSPWEQPAWLCSKHYAKIMLKLSRSKDDIKADVEHLKSISA